MSKPRQTDWQPPRGITLVYFPKREKNVHGKAGQPWGVQWRVNGLRKTKTFKTKEKQEEWAKSLAGDVKRNGLAAFRLDEGEAREWRAFRALVGADTDLEAVADCWERNKAGNVASGLSIANAVSEYTTAKKAEGLPENTLSHFKPIFDRLEDTFKGRTVGSIKSVDIAEWMAAQEGSEHTLRSRFTRVRALFNWLVQTQQLDRSPFVGMKPPKVGAKEVEILTLEQSRLLFSKNAANEDGRPIDQARREMVGRLALEAFAGLRNDTAGQIVAAEIHPDGLRIPAAKIKTKQNQFLDGLPANLHAWLKWAKPEEWQMTQRQYLEAKIGAFTRAGVPHPRNCLRKGFASYHVAAFKDPSKTSVIMCHTSPKMLWDTYRGIASQADGLGYFEIVPPLG